MIAHLVSGEDVAVGKPKLCACIRPFASPKLPKTAGLSGLWRSKIQVRPAAKPFANRCPPMRQSMPVWCATQVFGPVATAETCAGRRVRPGHEMDLLPVRVGRRSNDSLAQGGACRDVMTSPSQRDRARRRNTVPCTKRRTHPAATQPLAEVVGVGLDLEPHGRRRDEVILEAVPVAIRIAASWSGRRVEPAGWCRPTRSSRSADRGGPRPCARTRAASGRCWPCPTGSSCARARRCGRWSSPRRWQSARTQIKPRAQ